MRLRTMTLGAVSVLATGLLFAVSASAQSDDQTVAPSYLFTLEGRNVKLTPVSRSKTTFRLSIPIRGQEHLVGWFTDRPVRDAGHMTVTNFVRLWSADGPNSFKTDPPNVALAFGLRTLVAVMTEPRIIATKGQGAALVATFTLVQGEELSQIAAGSGAIVAHAKRAGNNALNGPLRIARAGLFIDSYNPSDDSTPTTTTTLTSAPVPTTATVPVPVPAPPPVPATAPPPVPVPATATVPAPAPAPPPPVTIPPPQPPWPYTGCLGWTCGI